MAEEQAAASQEQPAQQFVMQRIYNKDLSFESPSTPNISRKQWQPKVNVDLNTRSKPIDEQGNFEVSSASPDRQGRRRHGVPGRGPAGRHLLRHRLLKRPAASPARHRGAEYPLPLRPREHRLAGGQGRIPADHAGAGEFRRALSAGPGPQAAEEAKARATEAPATH
jgi:hypothetical protein